MIWVMVFLRVECRGGLFESILVIRFSTPLITKYVVVFVEISHDFNAIISNKKVAFLALSLVLRKMVSWSSFWSKVGPCWTVCTVSATALWGLLLFWHQPGLSCTTLCNIWWKGQLFWVTTVAFKGCVFTFWATVCLPNQFLMIFQKILF